MNTIVIGNIIALLGSILMTYSGLLKNKQTIIIVQTIQIILFIISNLILGGITGAIINLISCIRNILCYKDKLNKKAQAFILTFATIFSLMFNNLALVGLLPLISLIVYTMFMNEKNIIKFKSLIIFSSILWLIYDLIILSYTSAVFDFITILTNIISIISIIIINKKAKKSETKQ